ncbi:MAG: hypothetical protein OEV92_07150 [Nitrospinota bacterium]|nr:hypothetical protein [Nitrospinota bacterium]
MRITVILLAALLAHGGFAAAQVIKCQDENGEWHFAQNLETLPPYCIEKIRKENQAKEEEKKRKLEEAKAKEFARFAKPRTEAPPPAAAGAGAPAPAAPVTAQECSELPLKFLKCEPYECLFTNAKGKKAKRAIKGLDGKDCLYEETMTKNMTLACRYPEAERKQAANYYKMLMKAKKIESKTVTGPDGKPKSVDVMDGKEVDNLISSALNTGMCAMNVSQ